MGFRKIIMGTTVAVAMLTQSAVAEDIALIIGNASYRNFADQASAEAVLKTSKNFLAAGYKVVSLRDASVAGLQNAVAALEAALPDADRVVVVLSGGFLHSNSVTWFAPMDLRSPSLSAVGFEGLSIQALMGYLGQKPGGAALFLATETARGNDGLVSRGIGSIRSPQGVLLVKGTPKFIRKALTEQFLVPGRSLADAVRLSGETITSHGYVSDLSTLVPSEGGVSALSREELSLLEQAAYWKAALDLGTINGFKSYIGHYPNGEFVEGARARIQAIKDAKPKFTVEEQGEINLNLTRNDRSRVQEQLSFLGFDTRGIDGLFGPATRAALSRWQSQNERGTSGYLAAQDLQKLRAQAERRAKRLALEAQSRQQAQEAADAAFWQSTGANGSEADYLTYLGKYANGIYAETARTKLKAIEQRKRARALAAETSKWDVASAANTKKSYLKYLETFPNGAFADVARARITEIDERRAQNALIRAAKEEEEKLPLNVGMRQLLENQLKKLKLNPGKVDGVFNPQTRKALRRYQKSRGLEVSGFLTRSTIVQLMAE